MFGNVKQERLGKWGRFNMCKTRKPSKTSKPSDTTKENSGPIGISPSGKVAKVKLEPPTKLTTGQWAVITFDFEPF